MEKDDIHYGEHHGDVVEIIVENATEDTHHDDVHTVTHIDGTRGLTHKENRTNDVAVTMTQPERNLQTGYHHSYSYGGKKGGHGGKKGGSDYAKGYERNL
eukprot:513863_1